MAAALAAIWRVLATVIPLPLGVLLAIALVPAGWVAVKGRQHVRATVERLVAGERIAGLEAEIAARKLIAETAARLARQEAERAALAEAAAEELAARATQSELERQDLDDQIEELLRARPASGACTVDGDLLRRLRAK